MKNSVKSHIISKVSKGASITLMTFEETKQLFSLIESGYGIGHACECLMFVAKERRACGLTTFVPSDSIPKELMRDHDKRNFILASEKIKIFERIDKMDRAPEIIPENEVSGTFLGRLASIFVSPSLR